MQGDGDGDCAAGESSGSEGGAERSGKVMLRCSSQPSHRPTLLISCTEQLNSSVCPPSLLTDYWYLPSQCP